MKRIIAFMLATCMLFVATMLPTKEGHSQIVRSVTITAADDTLVNADTAAVSLIFDGSYKSVEALVEKVSGTVAGTVYFQGQTPDGGTWADIDSLTLSNTASQYKLFAVPNPRTYKAYRMYFITSGTTSVKPKVYTLRYTGG